MAIAAARRSSGRFHGDFLRLNPTCAMWNPWAMVSPKAGFFEILRMSEGRVTSPSTSSFPRSRAKIAASGSRTTTM